jgi:serine/threonine protein kinase
MPESRAMNPLESIAHYRIVSKLGEGGMGEVWQARDTKLGRDVAVKVLPDGFAADPDRKARFDREAQVLASLNHPNIGAIYGVEERALIMELVSGPTVADRIAQGDLNPDEALRIAGQIAEALEYAHERGVIHRDLKPANIKITPEGRVKVLDFGLAKAVAYDAPAAIPTSSPTLTMRATQLGVIVGTAAYMAPEQARGLAVDKRADIWAFGVVVYEMLTARRPFDGQTISDTLAAVLRAEVDWAALPPGLPSNIPVLLRRCVERDIRKRLRDIGDAHLELEQPSPPLTGTAPPAPPRRWAVLLWIVAGVFAVGALGLAAFRFHQAPTPAPLMRFSIPPPPQSVFSNWLALSPDGRHLAFSATGADNVTRLWVRSLDSLASRPLAGTEGANSASFFWSFDSRFLVFQLSEKLKKIDMSGGPPQTLCDATGTMLGGTWKADGVILFGSNSGPLMRISSAGGTATPVTRRETSRGELYHTDPVFLPDRKQFLYFRHSSKPEYQGEFAGSLDATPEQQSLNRIQPVDFSPVYAPAREGNSLGRLLFLQDRSLLAVPFDERRLTTAGEPVLVAEEVGTVLSRAYFSVSRTGALVYRAGASAHVQFTWYDRDGHVVSRVGQTGEYRDVALSRDGSRIAYSRPTTSPVWQIWILDLLRGTQSRLTFLPEGARSPVWSPDGRHVAFSSMLGKGVFVQEIGENGKPEQIVGQKAAVADSWSPDGSFLFVTQEGIGLGFDILAIPDPLRQRGAKPIPVAATEFNEMHAQPAPDAQWVAYDSDETGRSEIYVRSFSPGGGGAKWLVSSNGGSQPRWRADGKELYYVAPGNMMMAVDVSTNPTLRSATPHALFSSSGLATGDSRRFQYDVTGDGKRFLLIAPVEGGTPDAATVVLNWDAPLKK